MKIQVADTTIASKDTKTMTEFYKNLFGSSASVEDHGFFFKVKDPVSGHIINIVCLLYTSPSPRD